jgi:hypothetical protein
VLRLLHEVCEGSALPHLRLRGQGLHGQPLRCEARGLLCEAQLRGQAVRPRLRREAQLRGQAV